MRPSRSIHRGIGEANSYDVGLNSGSRDGAKAMERKLVMKLGELYSVVMYAHGSYV